MDQEIRQEKIDEYIRLIGAKDAGLIIGWRSRKTFGIRRARARDAEKRGLEDVIYFPPDRTAGQVFKYEKYYFGDVRMYKHCCYSGEKPQYPDMYAVKDHHLKYL